MDKALCKKIVKFSLWILAFIFAAVMYGWLNEKYNIGFPCTFNKMFGLYCSGCGLTRATIAMMHLDFYQAFRYNALSIVLIPLLVFLVVIVVWEYVFGKQLINIKIPVWFWVLLCIAVILYGIIRNFVPALQPVKII